MINKIISILLPALLLAFNLLAQERRSSLTGAQVPNRLPVQVIYEQEKRPNNAEVLDKINSPELSKLHCNVAELLKAAQLQATLKGGDALYVISIKPADPYARCFSIEAEILKLNEPYISEPNPAYLAKIHTSISNDSVVYTEIVPVFPGGKAGMLNFMNTNAKYPAAALKDKASGNVIVSCVLDVTGALTEISVLESIHPALDQEAVRIISAMPEWVPGYQNGKAVPIKMTLPVGFKMQGKTPKSRR